MGVAERRQREREERREQILDAAEQVFFTTSVESATMDEVAQAAELSKGALYLYFSSKDELLTAVMNRSQEGFIAELRRTVEGRPTGLVSLAAMLRAYVSFVARWPDHTRMILHHFAAGRPLTGGHAALEHHRELVAAELELVLSVIEQGKADGSIRGDVHPRELAVNMWGGLMGMMLLALNHEQLECELPDGQPDMDAAVESFLNLFLRGVAANPRDVEQLLDVV